MRRLAKRRLHALVGRRQTYLARFRIALEDLSRPANVREKLGGDLGAVIGGLDELPVRRRTVVEVDQNALVLGNVDCGDEIAVTCN